MMRTRLLSLFLVLLTNPVWAASTTPTTIDWKKECLTIYSKDCHQNYEFDPEIIHGCIIRGWDPPDSCLINEGQGIQNTSGSNGVIYGTVSAPEDSAGKVGAPPSVDTNTVRRTMGKSGWPAVNVNGQISVGCVLPGGFNICKLEQSQKSSPVSVPTQTIDPNDACPAKHDTSGAYGVKTLLGTTGGTSSALTCGGAIPLTTYEVTLNKNADAIASTEYGSFYMWLYLRPTNGIAFGANGTALKLPTVMCSQGKDLLGQPMVDTNGKPVYVKSFDLTPPTAQMIMYNSKSMPNLVVRLQGRDKIDPTIVPQPIPAYDSTVAEKYLVIPLKNGVPQIPSDPTNLAAIANMSPQQVAMTPLYGCALEADYLKPLVDAKTIADIGIDSAVYSGCEGTTDQCKTASAAPVGEQSCDVVNLSPDLPACSTKTQYAVLDRPNLVLPPGASASIVPINGRTSVLVNTVEGSLAYLPSSTILHLGKTSPPVTLNEGGSIDIADGSKLTMFGPVTIDPASGMIKLSGGGQHISSGGNLLQSFAASSNPTQLPITDVVITVNANRSMTLPANYLIPSMATAPASGSLKAQPPYIQVPVAGK